ncbi:MAG TPA: FecR family protein [Burkholderiaceae bacterium]|nr:FecR family protein [Burkholderiaceae bacterium]
MATLKNSTATKAQLWLLSTALLLAAAAVQAAPVGTVTDLSGPLLVRKSDGVVKVLSTKSTVDQGDTLVSEKDTYARIKFIDNSEITLRPNTQFKIDNFTYEATKPEGDNAFFTLIKGGLRSITGLLGKRNHERFGLNTPTATIGIRGTTFIAEYVSPTAADVAAYRAASMAAADIDYGDAPRTDAPQNFLPKGVLALNTQKTWQLAQNTAPNGTNGLNPGLYVQVLDGAINVSNQGGSQNFTAGQFGFTPGFTQPPVILPQNPGLQFTPPPSFSAPITGNGTGGSQPGDVDCQVR